MVGRKSKGSRKSAKNVTESRSREHDVDRAGGFDLSENEKDDVEDKVPPRATVLHEALRVEGEIELQRSVSALSWSSLAAGLSMGFSMLVPALLHAHLSGSPHAALIASLGYPAGFLIVILARQQLFTENTMTAVLPLMTNPGWQQVRRLLRLWTVVSAGNLVGVALFALAVRELPLFGLETHQALVGMGEHIMRNDWGQMFSKAIFAGWLVATVVWLVPAADTAKVWIIFVMTWLIALGGFPHIVVGTAEVLYLVFGGHVGLGSFIWQFALPTLAGNVVGGSLIFALLSHAQVRSEIRP